VQDVAAGDLGAMRRQGLPLLLEDTPDSEV
jgi:hypothetical protein